MIKFFFRLGFRLLLLLIGSLMNSCRKEYKFNLSTQRNPKN